MSQPVKLGIVGLGRWAKVLTRAVQKSDRLKIVAAYSRSEERRAAFEKELGVPGVPDMKTLLANPEIKGVVLTVPNEQHFPLAEEVASVGSNPVHRDRRSHDAHPLPPSCDPTCQRENIHIMSLPFLAQEEEKDASWFCPEQGAWQRRSMRS